jgi:hypothetical protein
MRAAHITTLVTAILLGGAVMGWPADAKEAPPAEWDGLQRVDVPKLGLVYVRPGASLADYNAIMLNQVQVTFSRDRDANGRNRPLPYQMTKKDFDRVSQGLADMVRKSLIKEVQQKGGYQIVNTPGPNVLTLTAALADVNITAPDVMTAGRSTVYASSKGNMTLVAQLNDSVTGELLARAIDRRADTESSIGFTMSNKANRLTNKVAAERIIDRWAAILRERLDAAREGTSTVAVTGGPVTTPSNQ